MTKDDNDAKAAKTLICPTLDIILGIMTEEAKPQEMEPLKPKIRRCIAMNEHGKMCRTRTRQDSYFCCESHTPKNLNNLKEKLKNRFRRTFNFFPK